VVGRSGTGVERQNFGKDGRVFIAWLPVVPVVVGALAVVLIPGIAATLPVRMGLLSRVALAGPIGVTAIGVAGIVSQPLHLPFSAVSPIIVALVVAIVLFVTTRLLPGIRVRPDGVRVVWLLPVWIVTALAVAVIAFWQVPSPDLFSQTYDNNFHLAAIAHILSTGDASSLTLRSIIETGKTFAFYPSGWHSIVAATVQVTGATVPVAVNAAWIAVVAGIWLPGAAWLAQALVPRHPRGIVALVAFPLGAAFGAMPYALLSWGTLYPTFLGTALLPAGVAVVVLAVRAVVAERGPRRVAALLWGGGMSLTAAAAIGFGQPRVLVSWAVLLLPFVLATAGSLVRAGWRRGGRSRRAVTWSLIGVVIALVVVAAVGFWYLVARLGLFTRPLDDRLGGPQAKATQSVLDGLGQVLLQAWPTGSTVTFPAVLLAAAVAGGILVALRSRGLRWIVVSYAVLALLFAAAAGSDDVVTKLATALWYKDRYRIDSVLPVIGVTLATLGVLAATAWLRRAGARSGGALALAGVVTATSAVALVAGGASASIGRVFAMPASHATEAIVSAAQIEFMSSRLPMIVPVGQRVIGDPWDGSGLSLLFGDREPGFPHVNGQWDPQRLLLAFHLQDIRTDPAVCQALDDLRVRYVLYNPHAFGGGDPSGNHFSGVHAAVEAGLFTPVATDGDTSLLEITQCGPLPAG